MRGNTIPIEKGSDLLLSGTLTLSDTSEALDLTNCILDVIPLQGILQNIVVNITNHALGKISIALSRNFTNVLTAGETYKFRIRLIDAGGFYRVFPVIKLRVGSE